jgi:NAD(P)-dependent dehydrogenase (short-subunit alcohol dehydrogenase family)
VLLQDKTAVVYGGAGAIGATVARTFAREGARVFLAGRTAAPLSAVADEITGAGGTAQWAVVDALDPDAVARHADTVVEAEGGIDVSFNAIGVDHVQGKPLTELAPEDFALPIATYSTTQFLTATAAARHMQARGTGVILLLSTTASQVAVPTDGFGPACAAVEALSIQLAGELGPRGVRVVCLRPDGIPESVDHGSHARALWTRAAGFAGMTLDDLLASSPGASGAMLGPPIRLADVAETAAFLASDRASAITATVANISRGAVLDT